MSPLARKERCYHMEEDLGLHFLVLESGILMRTKVSSELMLGAEQSPIYGNFPWHFPSKTHRVSRRVAVWDCGEGTYMPGQWGL